MTVFISHSHKDTDIVRKISADLDQKGIRVWIDEELISPGENWVNKISKTVEDSESILFIISRNTSQSRWQSLEIAIAISAQRRNKIKKLIPVVVDKDADIPFFLRDRVYVDLSNKEAYSTNLDKLVLALQKPLLEVEDFQREEEIKLEVIRAEKELLEKDSKDLYRLKGLWSSIILGAISSVIASSLWLFAGWGAARLQNKPISNDFIMFTIGIFVGSLGLFIAILMGRLFHKRFAKREGTDGE